jgi:hypothetical protein
MRFAFRNAGVDCVTVGYKNTAEIDEAIENLNLALAWPPTYLLAFQLTDR